MYILKYIYFTIILKPIIIILYYFVGFFFSPYVFINEKLYMSNGSKRNVYFHPNDNNKIIKIIKKERTNILEKIWNNNMENYRSYIIFGNIKIKSMNNGLIKTNLGIGIVYDLIKDYDNNISKNLKFWIKKNKISKNLIEQLIDINKYYYTNYDILIHINKFNYLVQKISKDEIRVVLIDGYDSFLYNKFCKNKDVVIKRVYKLIK